MISNGVVNIEFPPKMQPLFSPSRYKVLYGGRGAAKSWGVVRALLVLGAQKKLRILCARELQKSIADSVHKLLSDQVVDMGFDSLYEIQKAKIIGSNGTEFFFEALRHNAAQIKSYEGIDIVWVEEAQTVSKTSWDILIPTIRKDNSEIWLTFNPELDTDETYQRFVLYPPDSATLIKLNHSDNPWFPEVLQQEMVDCKQRDPDNYLNIWEGHCRQSVEGAIYATEIRVATEDNRICNVPYDAIRPVDCYWDLGWADSTSIWMVQKVGMEYRVIDFYQNCGQALIHYVSELQKRTYVFGTDYLPHDARAKQLGTGKSIEEMMRSLGRKVEIVPAMSVVDGIAAARAIFSACFFDQRRCVDGLQALRRYRYKKNPNTGQVSREPLHDENSHAADAFRYFAVTPPRVIMKKVTLPTYMGSDGWMGA